MPFTFFDHTGDIGIDLEAESLEALFADAAVALTAAMSPPDGIEPRSTGRVALVAGADDLLLVDWLSELLFRFETTGFLTRTADVAIAHEGGRVRLQATVHGEPVDADRHPIAVLVKGVTYHGLRVDRNESTWRARVILDI